jgi:tetratricopeptide (TPR) repeat protein
MRPRIVLFFSVVMMLATFRMQAQINTDQVMANAKNAIYFEDYVLSIQYLNKVIDSKSYLSEPYFFRGYAKYKLEDYTGALLDFRKALEINPYQPEVYRFYGLVNTITGKYDEAIAEYSKGLTVDAENSELLMLRGDAYKMQKNHELAIADFNQALKKDPKLIHIYLERGYSKLCLGDTVGALADYGTVIDRNPLMVDGYWRRAILYSQMKEYANALKDYDKAIELRPNETDFYHNRAVVRYQLDDLRNAMIDLDKAIELEPRNAMALGNRGLLRAEVGDLNRAVEDFSRVLALNSSDLITLFNRALIYNQIGEYRLAINDLNVIADNHPDFAPAYMTRAQAKQKLNDVAGANRDYNTAMKLEMDNRKKKDNDKNGTEALAEKQQDEDQKKKETRSQSDKDIKNYNKIAVLDDFEEKEDEVVEAPETIRGRIQNREIFIDLEPMFTLTYYSSDTLLNKVRYFDKDLEQFNRKKLTSQRLLLNNHLPENDSQYSLNLFNQINSITDDLQQGGMDDNLVFVRSILYSGVMNYNLSLDDLNQLIKNNPQNKLALFHRVYVRYRMVEMIRSVNQNSALPGDLRVQSSISTRPQAGGNITTPVEKILDYDLILIDLNKIIDIDPSFSYAYYNRGIVKCALRDFEGGLADFSKALELSPMLAEAWFNRGLTYIYLKRESEGISDLSKAGELGVFKAYNVIKRYGNISK